MTLESNTGLNVYSNYGKRNTGGTVGLEQVDNSTQRLSIAFTGESVNSAFTSPLYVPRGAKFIRAVLRVDEVFVVSAAGTLAFGGTIPGTNGIVLTEAELETVGTKTPTSTGAGTWAQASTTGTTASERVAKAITGTIGSTSGKATLILEYVFKTKV